MKTARFSLFRSALGLRTVGIFATITAGVAIVVVLTGHPVSVPAHPPTVQKVLSFTTMVGVDNSFVSNTDVRGVKGDELPWDVGTVNGSLTTDGHLHLAVTGIVFSNVPEVPPDLRGINDEQDFRAVVSCLTNQDNSVDGRGHGLVVTKNIFTQGFPATRAGNSTIDTTVTLPNPCVAPIVFVLSGSEDKWFAVTGSEE